MIYKYFLPVCGLSYILLMVIEKAEILNFDKVQFIHFSFMNNAFGVISKKIF